MKGKAMKHYYVLKNRETGKYYSLRDAVEDSANLKQAFVFNSRDYARESRLNDERYSYIYAEEVVEVLISKSRKPYRTLRTVR